MLILVFVLFASVQRSVGFLKCASCEFMHSSNMSDVRICPESCEGDVCYIVVNRYHNETIIGGCLKVDSSTKGLFASQSLCERRPEFTVCGCASMDRCNSPQAPSSGFVFVEKPLFVGYQLLPNAVQESTVPPPAAPRASFSSFSSYASSGSFETLNGDVDYSGDVGPSTQPSLALHSDSTERGSSGDSVLANQDDFQTDLVSGPSYTSLTGDGTSMFFNDSGEKFLQVGNGEPPVIVSEETLLGAAHNATLIPAASVYINSDGRARVRWETDESGDLPVAVSNLTSSFASHPSGPSTDFGDVALASGAELIVSSAAPPPSFTSSFVPSEVIDETNFFFNYTFTFTPSEAPTTPTLPSTAVHVEIAPESSTVVESHEAEGSTADVFEKNFVSVAQAELESSGMSREENGSLNVTGGNSETLRVDSEVLQTSTSGEVPVAVKGQNTDVAGLKDENSVSQKEASGESPTDRNGEAPSGQMIASGLYPSSGETSEFRVLGDTKNEGHYSQRLVDVNKAEGGEIRAEADRSQEGHRTSVPLAFFLLSLCIVVC